MTGNRTDDDDGTIMVTRAEAARRLSLSTNEIDAARRRGDLAAQRCGSKVLISVDELKRFAAALPSDEL
jgi:excisionase family DNA binding protein